MEKKLNSRQWRLYNFIKKLTLIGDYATKEKICDELCMDYELQTTKNETSVINNCPKIYQDIKVINGSCEIEKIIVVYNNKIYLGDESDCKMYAETLKIKALKLLTRAYNLTHKINSDGQGKIISCQGNVINDNSKARDFVESFVKEVKVW